MSKTKRYERCMDRIISIRSKVFLLLIGGFGASGLIHGRVVPSWTYEQMFAKADLVVIATVVSTKATGERYVLTDIAPAFDVVGVETDFENRIVVKGSKDVKQFRLHHYRFRNKDAESRVDIPQLIKIDLADHHTRQVFLLFLVKEPDGRYAPVTGQTDPAMFSVIELKAAAN